MKALLLLLAIAFPASADLPRRGMAGLMVQMEEGGVYIRDVMPGMPAEKAGLQKGDRILSVDGERVAETVDVTSRLAKHKGGETARIEYQRGEAARIVPLVLQEWPREKGEAYDAAYGDVTAGGNRYRTILTTPKSGPPRATVFIVQGVGCGSIDNPPGDSAYRALIESLSRRGLATLRVDKPGTGDSEGGPCATASFQTEVDAYRAGLASLKGGNVYLFGHSMGGIMAPLIAEAGPLKGIVVYGTVSSTWMQYSVENQRRQMRLRNEPFEEIEAEERETQKFVSDFYVQKKPLETSMAGKYGKYFQDVNDVPLMNAWKKTNVPLLAVWGASDFLTDGSQHEWLAAAVNSWRPGTAKYVKLDGIDHWLFKAASQKASLEREGAGTKPEYDDRIAEVIAAFIQE
jgi:pimeloyl-ACP methyl ester carboxylesterase